MSGLIEDKMFRLQVFKMGITRTALEGNSQHSYFTAREIRALFEWTDPSEGSTRKMLIDKHGVDSDLGAHVAADDDGGKTGWLDEGPAVGLIDFSGFAAALGLGAARAIRASRLNRLHLGDDCTQTGLGLGAGDR